MNKTPLVAVGLGFFMVILDVTIVNVALPTLATSLNTNISGLQWVIDGYTLTFACLLISAGNLGDRLGAKKVFLLGLIFFILCSAGCGLANNLRSLTICRLLQGTAAACLVPTSLALINTSYKDNQQRAKAIGTWGAIGGIAAAMGPLLGALLINKFSWRSVFMLNLPIGIASFILTSSSITDSSRNNQSHFDFLGQFSGIISIAALAFSLIEAGKFGWLTEVVITGVCIFLIGFIIFLLIEHYSTAPMLPLKLFQIPSFCTAITVGMLINISFYGELFVLTFYFQQVKAYSILSTGFAFMPLLGLIAPASYLSGKLISRIGYRSSMLIGLAIGTIGFLSMLFIRVHTPYRLLILPLTCIGLGIAFTMPAATVAAIYSAPSEQTGIAAGILNASRQLGSLMGVAIFGSVITTSASFIQGMHFTLLMGGAAFGLGWVWVFLT